MDVNKPTKEEVLQASNKTVPDLIKHDLKVLFVGINPGLYTAAIGHHFGHPGNRFWKALYTSGFTPRLYSPYESAKLLDLGYGITNIVKRATLGSADLTTNELREGGRRLSKQIEEYKPRYAAILGIDSYRKAFSRKETKIGLQDERIGSTKIWILPNPSGLNAHFTPDKLTEVFRELRREVEL